MRTTGWYSSAYQCRAISARSMNRRWSCIQPEPPGLHGLAELGVRPRVGHGDLGHGRRRQRHPRPEYPLVALEQQVPAPPDAAGRQLGVAPRSRTPRSSWRRPPSLSTPGGGRPATKYRSPTRYTSIGGIGSPRRCASASRSQRSRTRPLVGRNRRSKSRVESTVPTMLSSRIVCSPSRRSPRRPSAATHLVERQDDVDVVRRPAQSLDHPGQHLAAPDPQEVVFHVGARESGVSGHRAARRSRVPARRPGLAPEVARPARSPAGCRAGASRSR